MLSPLRRDGIPLVGFLLLTLLMTNPLVLHLAAAVEDKQDALLNTWIIAWVGHALITDPLSLFNANIFYPFPNTLAYSETMLPQGLFALPFDLAFHNTVLGYNLVLLGSFFLAAYGMYLFAFDLTRSRAAAAVAGTIFAFNPYNLGNLAQVQLLSFGWLPLAMMYLRRMGAGQFSVVSRQLPDSASRPAGLRTSLPESPGRASRREGVAARPSSNHPSVFAPRPSGVLSSLLFALFFSLQVVSSFYFAFLAGITVSLYVIWIVVVGSVRLRSNLKSLALEFLVPFVAKIVLALVVIAVLTVPFLLPYLQVQREQGFQRSIAESEPFSASLVMYSQVSQGNVVYGSTLAPHPPIMIGGYPLDNLFPGLVAVVLAIIGVARSKTSQRWFFLLVLSCAFLLSLGPRLYVDSASPTDVILPYRWLYDAFPLMKAFRAPVRFDALVMFSLALLAGFGALQIAKSSISNRISNFQLRFGITAIAAIALEYFAWPAANITSVPTGDTIPQYVDWLAKQPPAVALVLPMMGSQTDQALDLSNQYLSTYHWQRTPDGYSGFNPPLRGEIAYDMQSFPEERSISLLQALDVKYVVALGGGQVAVEQQTADVKPVARLGSDEVYRITPRAQEPKALSTRLYLPQPAAAGQNYWAYIVVQNRADRSFAIKPTQMPRVEARWNGGAPQRVNATMPLVTTSVSVIPVQILAPATAGSYHLTLRVAGDAVGEWDLGGDLSVKNEEGAHAVVLPAQVALSAPLPATVAPGAAVQVALDWKPLNKIDAYYSASVRVVDASGNKIVAVDRQPAGQTLLWSPGKAVPDSFTLTLPRDLAPGTYSLQVLMYQANEGIEALLLDDQLVPQASITLGTFTVK